MASLLLLTACSSGSSGSAGTPTADKPEASGTTGATGTTPTGTATTPEPVLPPIKAAEVVAGLSGAGYKCSNDAAYAICTAGPVSVWVLTGNHPRPPVVSLHSPGAADTASAEIAKVLPKALEIAHINQRQQITDWFGQQKGKTAAQLTAGDWQVDYSVEVDTEEPGAHLTLTDKLCKTGCQGE